jgi:Cu+-exporting ATPase
MDVLYDYAAVDPADLADAVSRAGFPATLETTLVLDAAAASSTATLAVGGMSCVRCEKRVTRALHGVRGVAYASVSVMTGQALVRYCEPATPRALLAAVTAQGFRASVLQTDAVDALLRAQREESAAWACKLATAAVFAIPLVIVAMLIRPPHRALDARVIKGLSVRELVCWALSTPIQFGMGMQFHIAAISSVRARVLGMDFLISLGTNAAYALSIVSVMTAVSTLYEVRVRLCAHSRLPPVSALA